MQCIAWSVFFYLMRKLAVVERTVEAALRDQLLVCAAFNNVSVLHNENDVRTLDRGQAVRYDKARAPLHHTEECLLYAYFRACIYR